MLKKSIWGFFLIGWVIFLVMVRVMVRVRHR
jgi:hypothetical protein